MNLSARLMAKARHGTIVIDRETFCDDHGFRCQPLALVQLKGKTGLTESWEVQGRAEDLTALMTPARSAQWAKRTMEASADEPRPKRSRSPGPAAVEVPAPAVREARAQVGTRCVLKGLVQRPELNGCRGTVVEFAADRVEGARLQLELDDGAVIKAHANNVEPMVALTHVFAVTESSRMKHLKALLHQTPKRNTAAMRVLTAVGAEGSRGGHSVLLVPGGRAVTEFLKHFAHEHLRYPKGKRVMAGVSGCARCAAFLSEHHI